MFLQHIIDIIESVAPLSYQEDWDNSGLQVGNRSADISAALLTTDVTEPVVKEAIIRHCNLIVSHHPLLYRGLKTISGNTPQERIVETAIRNGIAIYSSHTAMDAYLHGVSGRMAEKLGVADYRLLVSTGESCGLGVIGKLPEPVSFETLAQRVREVFGAQYLRCIPPVNPLVQTIAMCGGAGAEFMEDAIRQAADVYLSSDFKYHAMQDAVGRIGLIDIDHWVCEHFTRDIFAELLGEHLPVFVSEEDRSPVVVY